MMRKRVYKICRYCAVLRWGVIWLYGTSILRERERGGKSGIRGREFLEALGGRGIFNSGIFWRVLSAWVLVIFWGKCVGILCVGLGCSPWFW